jgi:hypothetical protein
MNETKPHTYLTFDQLERGYSFWQASGRLPEELLNAQNERVHIRGFLYKTELSHNDAWILAAEPNLKSCCVASPGKKGVQLLATGNLLKQMPLRSTAVGLEGHLQFLGAVEGPFYGLSDASMHVNTPSYALPVLGILMVVLIAYVKIKV